jgi:hypothetical protein
MRNAALADPAVRTVWIEALFASLLQPSADPTPDEIRDAVRVALRKHGGKCNEVVAFEYGRHPGPAAERMRWCCLRVAALVPAPRPAGTEPATADA